MTKNANFSPRSATKGCCKPPRKINLSVSVSLRTPILSLPPSCSLESSLGVPPPQPGDRSSSLLSSRAPEFSPSSALSFTLYEREDLLAAEYNADLSVSIHRDREPSSSRVPLRRGYTYPPSAARRRRGTEKAKRGGRNRGERRAKEVAKQMAAMLVLKTRADPSKTYLLRFLFRAR
ncbi:hypothetical protein ALC62_07470 [Cyphomyrmex costatus]|uniref:Uncharacterized protein n=1 Tax=Cyphomyrmex costatus TaxID=456900 RepID=A0A195CM75_9HYME|nr:hypothetical protein ALC62_07470 [Cyphomyrmex costatus]